MNGNIPAFPVSIPGVGDNGWHGMTYRQWLIGMAISGAARIPGGNAEKLAHDAIRVADAVIAKMNEEVER